MGYLYDIISRFLNHLTSGVSGQQNFQQAGIFLLSLPVAYSFSAYSSTILNKKFGVEIYSAIMLGIILSFFLGMIFSYLYNKVSKDSFTVLSLSSILAFDAFVRSFDSLTGGVLGISGVIRPQLFRTIQDLILLSLIISIGALCFHFIIQKSPMGRKIRALKEHPNVLETLGSSKKTTATFVISSGFLLASLSGILDIYRIQFLDPSFGGIPNLIILLSISILAYKPQVKSLILATAFVICIPELIKFLNFPSALLGHLRTLTYSTLLITLLFKLSNQETSIKRET